MFGPPLSLQSLSSRLRCESKRFLKQAGRIDSVVAPAAQDLLGAGLSFPGRPFVPRANRFPFRIAPLRPHCPQFGSRPLEYRTRTGKCHERDIRHSEPFVIRSHTFRPEIPEALLEAPWPHPARLGSCNVIASRQQRRTGSPRTTLRSDRIFWRPSAGKTSNGLLVRPGCFL